MCRKTSVKSVEHTPEKLGDEGGFLLFKYFLMTCQSATKIRFECLSTAEKPQPKI